MILRPRDEAIIKMIYNYDRVMIEHLRRVFFPTRYDTCYKRLAKLVEGRYLTTQLLFPTTPMGAGKILIGLGIEGRRLVAEHYKKSVQSIPILEPFKSGDKGQHHGAICHFRISLEQACRVRGDVSVIDWTTERHLQKQKLNPRPDGLFTLEWNGKTQDYRLEMDMDNHERWYMLENFKAYLKLPERSPVLYVVPSEKRKNYLLQWALAVATKDHLDSSFIWVAVMPKNPLDYVWYAPNTPEAFPLLGGPWGSP